MTSDSETEIGDSTYNAYFKWNDEMTFALLDAYCTKRSLFLDPQTPKKDLWSDLLQEMHSRGYQVPSADALNSKICSLKERYNAILQIMSTGSKPIKWTFFEKMSEIFSTTASLDKSELEFNRTPPVGGKPYVEWIEEYRWEDDAVDLLLDAYRRRRHLFLCTKVKKKDLWTEILHELWAAGHDVQNEAMLDAKMNNLKKTYRRKKQEILTGDYTEWRYFDQLDEIWSNDDLANYLIERAERQTSATTGDPKAPSEDNKWDQKATEFLLDAYQRKLHLFHSSTVKKQDVWKNICLEMKAAGFEYENIHRKLLNLKKTYRRNKKKLEAKGGVSDWLYFDKMDQIFRDDSAYARKSTVTSDEEMVSCDEFYSIVNTSHELDRKPKTAIAFEFINTTPVPFGDNTDVKTEPIVSETIGDKRDQNDCGKIRFSLGGKFLFVCGYCNEEHKNMIQFGAHLKKRHRNKLISIGTRKPPDESTDELEVFSNTLSNEMDQKGSTFSLNPSEARCENNRNINSNIVIEPVERQCKYCGEEFTTRALCIHHERTHLVDSPFPCWYCPEKFCDYKQRNVHIRIHKNEPSYKERLKTFAQKWQRQHPYSRNHLDKEFKCQTCGKEFLSKIGLYYHERVKCQQKLKNEATTLVAHLNFHSGDKSNVCDICGKDYVTSTALQSHLRSLHRVLLTIAK